MSPDQRLTALMITLLLASLSAAAPGTAPVVVAPAGPSIAGRPAQVRVLASDDPAYFVDGCAPIELERDVDGAWVAVAVAPCLGHAPAEKLAAERSFPVTTATPGRWRAVLPWGIGCSEGVPLELAACKKLGFSRSEPFQVDAPPRSP